MGRKQDGVYRAVRRWKLRPNRQHWGLATAHRRKHVPWMGAGEQPLNEIKFRTVAEVATAMRVSNQTDYRML